MKITKWNRRFQTMAPTNHNDKLPKWNSIYMRPFARKPFQYSERYASSSFDLYVILETAEIRLNQNERLHGGVRAFEPLCVLVKCVRLCSIHAITYINCCKCAWRCNERRLAYPERIVAKRHDKLRNKNDSFSRLAMCARRFHHSIHLHNCRVCLSTAVKVRCTECRTLKN